METYTKQDFDFSKWGAFFAFGSDQFNEQKKEGQKYYSLGAGLLAEKENCEEMLKAFNEHTKEERKRRLRIEGKEKIIRYELINHEAFYTGDLDNVIEELKPYGIKPSEILAVYKKMIDEDEMNEEKQF